MLKIKLKDNSELEVEEGLSVIEIAKKISEGLARVATCAEIDGEVVDLRTIVEKDCSLNILTFESSLNGKKAYAVIDKSVSFGWNTGVLYNEIKSAVSDLDRAITSMPAIGGLGGADISVDMLLDCIKKLDEESKNYNGQLATYWFE